MPNVLKFCNNCRKPKFVKASHNYANCCGGRTGFRNATAEELAEFETRQERLRKFIAECNA